MDAFEAMMDKAGSAEFQAMIEENAAGAKPDVSNEVYKACFDTPAGRAVIRDLYNRYVNGTRFNPAEGSDYGFYREGGAAVIFDLAARVEAAAIGEMDDE